MKKVVTNLSKEAVEVAIYANDNEVAYLVFPVNVIAPQLSLQIAGMLSSDPTLPRVNEKSESTEQ